MFALLIDNDVRNQKKTINTRMFRNMMLLKNTTGQLGGQNYKLRKILWGTFEKLNEINRDVSCSKYSKMKKTSNNKER